MNTLLSQRHPVSFDGSGYYLKRKENKIKLTICHAVY